ncbi:MAG TPA: ParB/RepB/Spo0J family partition protein, partial [Nitrososphaeraceae archaeon]|nr:ParB/RepB/Spo0J family partition protein [Nitrososphaeraceae archaeon]
MSLKSKYQLMDIPINEIHESDWDVRHTAAATVEEEKDYDGLNGLTKSILTDGLLSPIIVNPIDQGFEVIAGRRRLKACKNARIEKIPSFVILDKNWTKADLHRITYAENVFRKDLKDLDKSYGILKRFQDYGYTPDQTIKGVKSIDNWFSDHTNNKTDWDALLHNLVME